MANRPVPPRPAPAAVALLNQAVALHQAGRLDEAETAYRRIVAQTPGHFDATHLLGVLALQRGDLAQAQALISQALASKPKDAPALSNLGIAYLRADRLDEAREQFERATKAHPAHAEAQANLGTVLRRLGRVAESIAPLRRAFAADPRSASAANLLGASLLETGDARGAVAVFEACVKAQPRDPAAWTNLAIASQDSGNAQRAHEAADQALRLEPGSARALAQRGQALATLGDAAGARQAFADAVRAAPNDAPMHHNFGTFLREQGEFDEAAGRLREALRIDPAFGPAQQALVDTLVDAGRTDEAAQQGREFTQRAPEDAAALGALGAALFGQDRVDEAIAAYARAAAARGADADVFVGYGNALFASGNAAEATRQFARAVELYPEDARARFALAMSHLRPIYDDDGQMAAARRDFTRAIADLDRWCTPARAVAASRHVGSAQPFYLAYHPVDLRPLLAPYGKTVARVMSSVPVQRPAKSLAPLGRKLRVGIAAAQVRDHSVWNAITRGWVQHLDRDRFELSLFQLERQGDAETARARTLVDRFVDAPARLEDAIRAILDARLDVLIYPEISMHPLTTRLAATRLAPVQATTWGHPQTSGLPTIDLFFSAQAFEPPQGASHYCERLVALPGIGVSTSPLRPASTPPDLAALGLSPAEPLLLCPGTPFKYTPASDAAWVAIAARLQARGSGRLVFFRSKRAGMSSQVEQRMRRAFAAAGVDHDRTVAWIPTLARDRFFGLMRQATLGLDTIGFSGFNTAMQALECDQPFVAFEGDFMRGRLASGPLRHIGLDELVARSIDEFADIALRLVEDDAWRLRLKGEIAARRGRLFDDVGAVRAFEQALLEATAKR